jgi:hypothetical protein
VGEKKKIGAVAERAWQTNQAAGTLKPAIAKGNCDVDNDLPPITPPPPREPRFSDWLVAGVVVGEAALLAYSKLRGRTNKIEA